MAIKIVKGTIKVGEEYIGSGAVLIGLNKEDEQRLISEKMAAYVPDIEVEDQCEGGFDLNGMTVAQLKAFAKTNGIDIGKAKKHGDILVAIEKAAEAAKAAKAADNPDEDEEDDDPDA